MKTRQHHTAPFFNTLRSLFMCAVLLVSLCGHPLFAQTYQTNGSAVNNGGGLVRMTAASIGNQTASAWSTTKINLTQTFDMSFDMFFGCDNGANGGDGMTFTFHNDPRALNAVGDGFGYLGLGGSAALSPALSIEFDTYDGTASGGSNELADDHIAVDINGDVNQTTYGPNNFVGYGGATVSKQRVMPQIASPIRDLESCAANTSNYYTIRVVWTYTSATSQSLQLYEEGTLTMTYTGNLINTIFGGSPSVYWGFTGATGSASNEQWIAPQGTVIPWQCASGSCCTAYTLTKTGPGTVCTGSISVGVTPSSGSAPTTYNWSNGATTSTTNITSPGTYTINVQQNQAGSLCPATLTFNIISTGGSGVMTGGATICDDGTSTTPLNVALTGTQPWSITYSIDGVNQTPITGITSSPYIINAKAPHTYALTSVSDNSACSNGSESGSAVVKGYPALPVGHDNTFSAPASTNLSVDNAGGTYEWYDAAIGGSLVYTGTNYTTPVLATTTTYYVKNTAITPFTNKSIAYLNNTQYGTGGNNTAVDNTGLPKAVLWLNFTANSSFTFNSVSVDVNITASPQVAGSQVTVYIDDLTNGALSTSVTKTISGLSVATPQSILVNLAYSIIAGHNYRISYEGAGSVKGIMYWDFVGARAGWTTAPATITKDPEVTITSPGQGWYPGMFNWQITVGSPASSCGRTPVTAYASLPVRLLYFKALLKSPGIALLEWSTASEENNDYFTLQRSADGIHFTDIAIKDGAGNSSSVNNYSHLDMHALSGTSYYRVKQTDFDGKFSFSNIAKIDDTALSTFSVNLSPNPANSGSSIFLDLFGADAHAKIPVAVYDMLGRLIYSTVFTSNESGTVHEDLGSLVYLVHGTYIISVAPANQTEYKQKIMIY